ncbi:YciI family protein [Tropicimonas isoalkanivorans]|uniref:YCII-related domain-containing protein n=1 Tax=Tropicimonas isoalkanivorans TaxID=441112 RepID=A0A1I1REE8_9RHOB|nr:YciI family protein [Tropicimonas isoalkanivorans]SFD28770.1 hypothetical protein SAMN04488094_1274 [Tropicimonas isoalkanivorans]
MLVAIICKDKPGALQTRKNNRAAHLEHVDASGVVTIAGPFLDDAGEMCGSLVILDVEDMTKAEEWAAKDPYALAGLFESVEIKPWKKVIG